jgi:hypothetical protein
MLFVQALFAAGLFVDANQGLWCLPLFFLRNPSPLQDFVILFAKSETFRQTASSQRESLVAAIRTGLIEYEEIATGPNQFQAQIVHGHDPIASVFGGRYAINYFVDGHFSASACRWMLAGAV